MNFMYIQCISWPRRQGVGRACATGFRGSKDTVFPRCRTPLPMRPGRRSQPSQRSPHPKSAGHALLSLPRNLGVEDSAPGCNFTTWKRQNVARDIAISTLVTLLCKIYSNINTQQYSAHVLMCTTHVPSLPVVLRCKSCWQTMQTTPTSPHHFELAQLHGMFLLADSHPATPFRRFDVLVCLILQLDTLSRYISRYLDMQQHLQQQRLQIPRTSKPNYPTLSWNSLRPCVRTYRSH